MTRFKQDERAKQELSQTVKLAGAKAEDYDAALVDAMMTVAQAEALANWVALHK